MQISPPVKSSQSCFQGTLEERCGRERCVCFTTTKRRIEKPRDGVLVILESDLGFSCNFHSWVYRLFDNRHGYILILTNILYSAPLIGFRTAGRFFSSVFWQGFLDKRRVSSLSHLFPFVCGSGLVQDTGSIFCERSCSFMLDVFMVFLSIMYHNVLASLFVH